MDKTNLENREILPFYSKEGNLVPDQEVICRPIRLDKNQGVYVLLPEFGDIEGFIPISMISSSKRERQQPQKIIKIGKIFVARVHDNSEGDITLSCKNIQPREIENCKKRFDNALTMLKIVENMSQLAQMTTNDCHSLIMWPLYNITEDPMEFCQSIIVQPEQINALPIENEHHALLVEVVIKTIGQSNASAQRKFNYITEHNRGIDAIKYAAEQASKIKPPNNVQPVNITYQGSHYLLSCKCPHPSIAESYLEQVETTFLEAIKNPEIKQDFCFDKHPDAYGIGVQAVLNVGLVGHVQHGKSTVCKAISGVKTQRYSKEKSRNITIKLGYTNAKIFRCTDGSYISGPSTMEEDENRTLVTHISFIDCPGHDEFITTMLGGSSLMDAAMLVIAANEGPQAQTEDHLLVMDIIKMKNMAILQNKTELIDKEDITKEVQKLHDFVKGTVAEDAPVIPISANLGQNMEAVYQYISQIPSKMERLEEPFLFACVRSFCINPCGSLCAEPKQELCIEEHSHHTMKALENLSNSSAEESNYLLKGAVLGGSILRGKLQVGDEIEIRPGKVEWQQDGSWISKPYFTRAKSLKSDTHHLSVALPGGCVAIQTFLDPGLGRDDKLVGQLIGKSGSMPKVYHSLDLEVTLIQRDNKIKLEIGQTILLQVLTCSVSANIIKIKKMNKKKIIRLELSKPICAELGKTIALSQSNRNLIGYGIAIKGTETLVMSKQNLEITDKDLSNQQITNQQILDSFPSSEKNNDLIDEEMLIDKFISFMENQEQNKNKKLLIKPPELVKDGGKRFRWTNVYTIMEQLNRSVESLQKFIISETGQNVNLNQQDKVMILHGAFKKKQINSILIRFATKRIQCNQCKSFKTTSTIEKSLESIICMDCNAERYINLKNE